ncbi:hypothetical protein SPRG_06816 [Saprolegnia parasitica CBS 223.65]|uniref:Uncharacterized protein n=1 Tax=Saprolegnia parasitica (strain CBS 223.65) TaxID=695850 RepID=A0A067CAL5_SAPPC|nr:hypothetical protein SPRG_06816 [Saprolegnia parasitica CBS 223.65]KDO27548.1 hypothetical protein SPRG_06816 [Saprolegnia parasitica CBS 223.65]|eukprot:XP_012201674.1 hypothetical protein SPRG_06816 [Saprolegnia parasitica CBS 223.65]
MRASNERKRKARAEQKASETPEEEAARQEKQRLTKATARAVEKATETPEEEVARLEKQRLSEATARAVEKATETHEEHDGELKLLADRILADTSTSIDAATIGKIAASQNFTKHPKLAIAAFHLCSGNPDAHMCNDESLNGPGGREESARQRDAGSGRIAACASFNKALYECEVQIVDAGPVEHLPAVFRLDDFQGSRLPRDSKLVSEVVSVLRVDGVHYHLNPSLVPDKSNVVLCLACAKDPTAGSRNAAPFSIAKGHDYGWCETLPKICDATLCACH